MTDLPEGVELLTLTPESVLNLWLKVKDYDRLFSDDTRGDIEGFYRDVFREDTILLGLPNGVLTLSRIKPGLSAECHAVFFDHRLRENTESVKGAIIWAFIEFDLHRLGSKIPSNSNALRRWMMKGLGFRNEGVLRNEYWYKGQLQDTMMLSLLREEVLNGTE